MKSRTILTTALILAAAGACRQGSPRAEENEAAEQEATKSPESQPAQIQVPADLAARAKISLDSAKAVALARVPGGTISGGELEDEGGQLIYSFDIAVAGQPGVEEVWVDAIAGDVISVEHEGPAKEAAEGDTAG